MDAVRPKTSPARRPGTHTDTTSSARTHDDADLVDALARGDEDVFSALMDRLHPDMHRAALGLLGDTDLADDVIQETWLAVVQGIGRFEARSSLRTWIFRILMNRAKTRAARERRYVALDEAAPPAAGVDGTSTRIGWSATRRARGPSWHPRPDPSEWVLAREVIRQIESAIETLPPNQRTTITLRDLEGWSSKEVCERLGITPGHQRVLLHRARQAVREKIRSYLEPGEEGDGPGRDTVQRG